MKTFKILLIAGLALFIVSCRKMSYFQEDPNAPTKADPSLELTNLEQDLFNVVTNSAPLACRQVVYLQTSSNNQYYGWKRAGFSYGQVSQAVKMQMEAKRTGKPNYYYLGKFFIDAYIIDMTRTFGDIPYSQIMQSLRDGNFDSSATHPVYDKQHDIYLGVLNDLKIVSDSLSAANGSVEGDIIYGGDLSKWKQLVNGYTLRVLMSLSKKESDPSLNIKQRFQEIVNNPNKYPLLSSNDDNGQLDYYDVSGNRYPYYNDNSMKTDYDLEKSFVNMLKGLNDPRLFVYGRPTTVAIENGLSATDFDAYAGLPGSAPLGDNKTTEAAGKASQMHKRYSYVPINEPSVFFGYAEQQFILAEAVVRGWISGDADAYYKEGIRAAMKFSNFENTYSQSDIDDYINQPMITLQSGTEIKQIITQKYISMYMNTGWQPFYEHRRTGYPHFDVSGSGIINQINDQNAVPLRWMYPIGEYDNNAANVEAAVDRQYPNGDNVNGEMWLLK